MISRRTKAQLAAFVVLAGAGVVYVGGEYAGLGRLVGSTTYTVTLELADSGGIFTNAEVTHRGVTVGRVGELEPTEDGVLVELDIDEDADPIPAEGVRAEVRNLSLIGEPYVDLTAAEGSDDSGPFLEGGEVIPAERTSTPVAPAVLLSSLDGLLESVPRDSVEVVLRELDAAFADTGNELGALLDNTSALVETADDVLPETIALIEDGATVLRTQNEQAGSIRSFSRDLRLLSATLETSDADLRRLLRTGPQASTALVDLLQESGPGLSRLVADLVTSGRVTGPRTTALRQLLITYPALARAAYSAVPGDGTVHFGLVLNAFDPQPCTDGYEGTKRRPGTATRDVPVNEDATCREPQGSPIAVRGSQRAPREGTPPAAQAPPGGGVSASSRASSPASPDPLAQVVSALAALSLPLDPFGDLG